MSGPRTLRPWLSRVSALLAVLLLGALPLVAATPTPAAAAGPPPVIAMTTVRGTLLDPLTGRFFVAGDDEVLAFAPDGTLLKTIPDIFGAGGMDTDNAGNLWVPASNAASLVQINTSTLTVTNTYGQGRPVGKSVALARGAVWFPTSTGLGRFDTTSKLTSVRGTAVGMNDRLVRIPAMTTRIIAYDTYSTAVFTRVIDLTVSPAVALASAYINSGSIRQMPVSSDGTRFWIAAGSPYNLPEYNVSDLTLAGPTYPATYYPVGAAYSTGHGGTLATVTSSTNQLYVSHVGAPVSTHVIALPGSPVDGGTALSSDGNRAYVVVTASGGISLATFDLTSSIASATPSTVVSGVPTTIDIRGNGLGLVSAASVDGVAVTPTAISSTELTVTLPVSVGTGTKTISLTTPWGVVTTTIQVVANTGATLSGTVRSGSTAVSGIQLTLSGGGLASARQTTTAANGTYTFSGVPYGTTYQLAAHDPTAALPDQAMKGIVLVPNGTPTIDLDLQVPVSPVGPRLADLALPVGPARHMTSDPATGRVFVSAADEVIAFDRDGSLLARFQSQWGADGLAISGSKLYVNLSTVGSVTTIDIPTLTLGGSFTVGLTDGELAVAANKLVYTTGNDQWVGLSTQDLTTHAVTAITGGNFYVPNISRVDGSPNLVITDGGSFSYLVDVATGTAIAGGVYTDFQIGSQSLGLTWSGSGTERKLSDLTPSGVQYPVDGYGIPAFGPGNGGVLAFGRNVVRAGIPKVTHQLPDVPALSALASAGDRAYYTTANNHLVVYDLKPYLTSVGPAPVYDDGAAVTINGSGLGAASSVKLDGTPLPIFTSAANQITVTLPVVTPGSHTLQVVTPWGTSAPLTFTAIDRPPVPAVTALSTSSVPTAGGPVQLTGSGFTGATAVTFGGVPATSFTVVNDTRIDAVAPIHTVATGAVAVTTLGGTNPTSPPFGWVAPTPIVTSISPIQGPLSGGTTVTIHGSGFLFPTAVTFGGTQAASVSVQSDTTIVAIAPAHAAGAVDVKVSTSGGTSAPGASSTFTYQATAPSVTTLTPNQGLATGGEQVVVKGSGLAGATGVSFGTTAASSFVVVDANTIVAVAPAHAAGVVTVTVTNPSGTSSVNLGALYQYNPIPVGVISGTVTSKAGPTGGMLVVVSPTSSFSVYATATTAADGSYSIGNLPSGTYRVLVLDPGIFSGASSYFVSQWYDHGGSTLGDFATATTVTVSGNAVTTLNPVSLTHNSPGTISGTVRNGASAGLANQMVFLYSASNPNFTTYVITDGTGHFSLTGLPPGAYKVGVLDAAELFGSASHYISEFYDNGGPLSSGFAAATTITVAPNGSVTLNPIVLAHTP